MKFDTSRYFGVEIETTLPCDSTFGNYAARQIELSGLPAGFFDYSHRAVSVWKLMRDGSCGLEIISPKLQGEDGFRQILS